MGKASVIHPVFGLQLSCLRMGLGPGALLTGKYRAHKACAGLTALCGTILPVSDAVNAPLSWLKVCAPYGTWPTPLFYLSFQGEGAQGPFH